MIDSDEASRVGIGNGDDSSSSEKSSFESIQSIPAPATPPAIWMSQWCVQGMQHINRDDIQHGDQVDRPVPYLRSLGMLHWGLIVPLQSGT